jgi:hypothetical protein
VKVGCTGGFVAAVANQGPWDNPARTFDDLFMALTSQRPTATAVSDSGQRIVDLAGSSAGGISLNVEVHANEPAAALIYACND